MIPISTFACVAPMGKGASSRLRRRRATAAMSPWSGGSRKKPSVRRLTDPDEPATRADAGRSPQCLSAGARRRVRRDEFAKTAPAPTCGSNVSVAVNVGEILRDLDLRPLGDEGVDAFPRRLGTGTDRLRAQVDDDQSQGGKGECRRVASGPRGAAL